VDDENSEPEDSDSSSKDSKEDNEIDNNADSEWTELQHQITRDQAHNICHKPVKVARHHNPFATTTAEEEFHDILHPLQ
jgi:hypothetical protein